MEKKDIIKFYKLYKLVTHKFMLKVKGVYCYKHKEEEYIHDGSFEEVVNYLLYKKNVITRYDDDSHGWMAEIIDYADVENEITIKLPDILSSNPLPNRGG